LDELSDLEQRAQARLDALAPRVVELELLMAEYNELRQLIERLRAARELVPAGSRETVEANLTATLSHGGLAVPPDDGGEQTVGAPTAAKPGEREAQLLEFVRRRPGITLPEAAEQLGVEPTGLYEIVRRLQSRYQVIKEGAALYPVGVPEAPVSD
jgi:hypothetical protein